MKLHNFAKIFLKLTTNLIILNESQVYRLNPTNLEAYGLMEGRKLEIRNELRNFSLILKRGAGN